MRVTIVCMGKITEVLLFDLLLCGFKWHCNTYKYIPLVLIEGAVDCGIPEKDPMMSDTV